MPHSPDIPLWLLIGLPGSGKSTWARSFQSAEKAITIVSTDRIRGDLFGNEAMQGPWPQVWDTVVMQFRAAIRQTQQGQLVGTVYDATNTKRQGRRQIIKTAHSLGFNRILAVWLDVPLAECLQRNEQRSRQVPVEVIHTMARSLAGAPPDCAEGFDALYRLRPF
ncbi:MAG: AAA family ATPase [Cyanobacteria bacterium P01_C01_bin.120]